MNTELNKEPNFEDLLSLSKVKIKEDQNNGESLEEYLYKNDLISIKELSCDKQIEIFYENIKTKQKPKDLCLIEKELRVYDKAKKNQVKAEFVMMAYVMIAFFLFLFMIFNTIYNNNVGIALISLIAYFMIMISIGFVINQKFKNMFKVDKEFLKEDVYSLTQGEYICLKAKTPDEKFNRFLIKRLLALKWSSLKIKESSLHDEFFKSNWQKKFIGEVLKDFKNDDEGNKS